MRKLYFLTLLFIASITTNAQLLTFDFAGLTGNEASATSNFNSEFVTQSSITRGAGLQATGNMDRFNSNSFTQNTTPDLTDYLEFTITPTTNSLLTINNIVISGQRSATGPTSFVIRTSIDDYATNATNVVIYPDDVTTQTNTFTFTTPIVTTTPITIRIYAYAAEGQGGTFGPGDFNGNDIIVNGTGAVNAPLPVKLSNLKAVKKEATIALSFSNLTETDVVNYSIERSENGNSFTSIAQLKPLQNNGSEVGYNFIDEQPSKGVNFYRIKATEANGKIAYSVVVKINATSAQSGLTIFPNPVKKGQLNFQVTDLASGDYTLSIRNASGQIVYKQSLRNAGNSFSQTVPLHNLKSGMYYLELAGATKMSKQFIIE